MNEFKKSLGVGFIQVTQFVDERGKLQVLEAGKVFPFEIRRVFWISDIPEGRTRGGHAHWTCHEAVFAISGSFEIEIDDGKACHTYTIDSPTRGIMIPAGVWCELRHFTPGTVCLVMASQEYDASGYSLNRQEWLAELEKRHFI